MKSNAYLIQALLIGLWWVGLFASEDFFAAFQFSNIDKTSFQSFFLPDITIIGGLSIYRAYKDSKACEFIILGGFAFATLYCINASFLTGSGYLPTLIMILGLCYNMFLVKTDSFFKTAQTNSTFLNATKTILQIICVWSITLGIIPFIITKAFPQSLNTNITIQILALFIFLISSSLGVWSAISLVKNGKGTPLPLDQTQQLVTQGPYQYIRNPMAVAGLLQGVAVSLYLGSLPVFLYTVLGALLWQYVVRPSEEKDMLDRFGSSYSEYKSKVRCWWPDRGSL